VPAVNSSLPEAAVKARMSTFESQVYAKAASRQDYLQRIAKGLTNVERSMDGSTGLARRTKAAMIM
jgi:hypothetical protein